MHDQGSCALKREFRGPFFMLSKKFQASIINNSIFSDLLPLFLKFFSSMMSLSCHVLDWKLLICSGIFSAE